MELTAAGAVTIGLAVMALISARAGAALLGATIPLSASAALVLGFGGGVTVLCATIAALALIVRETAAAAGRALRGGVAPPTAAWALIGFTLVAVVGAVALPRLFMGETLVYAMDRTATGVTEGAFKTPLIALAPGPGALTQSAYLIASAALFLAIGAAQRRDRLVAPALIWAASASHIVFGLADIMGAGWMAHFRTATYQIAPGQAFAGFTRVIGGAPEPSVYGLVGAALAVWHLWRFAAAGRLRHAGMGAALAGLSLGALSSTAIAAFALMIALWLARALATERRLGGLTVACFGGAALVALVGWVLIGPLSAHFDRWADALFLDKLTTESGVERAAWTAQALTNFTETHGLGVGLGASRANGWWAAVLGQTGAPGAALAALFLWRVFATPGAPALRAAAATLLAGAMLSGVRVDLGFLFFALAGAASAEARTAPIEEDAPCAPSCSTASS